MDAPVSSYDKVTEITEKDLPCSCPPPHVPLWNAHPRIYLPIKEEKQVSCPYCGAQYKWIED